MKKILLVFSLILLVILNPGETRHEMEMIKAQRNLRLQPSVDFLEYCDHHDYLLFSTDSYLGTVVSFGIADNVVIRYDALRKCMHSFYEQQLNSCPNSGPDG